MKAGALLDLLRAHAFVRIYLVTHSVPGLHLPMHLAAEGVTALDIGLNSTPPMDPIIDAAGIRATPTFGGKPFFVFIPWDAVIDAKLPADIEAGRSGPTGVKKKKKRPQLVLVPKDLPFKAELQDFSKVPLYDPRIKTPRLRIVRDETSSPKVPA